MLKIAVGHSEQIDPESVVDEIFEQCSGKLDGNKPNAGLLFAAVDTEYAELLEAIQAKWPGLDVVGCTTDGEMSNVIGFVEDSVVLVLFYSDNLEITVGIGRSGSQDLELAAQQAYAQAIKGVSLSPSLCIITPSSLTFSDEKVVQVVKNTIGSSVKLFGGVAGDQWRFEKTYQFYNNEVMTDAIPMILFSGPISISSSAQSGWKGIGPVGTITKAEGNIVYNIDDMTALAFYKSLLGDAALPSGDRPLAILDELGNISRLRASNESFDPKTGSISFFGEFTEGDKVQITVADRNEILSGTRTSIQLAKKRFPEGAKLEAAMFFSCSARKLLLGTRTSEEYDIIKEELGDEIPIFGFYGYGEIGPSFTAEDHCEFHNETFITVLLGS